MAEDALRQSLEAGNSGRKRLKKHGAADKLDYRTCRLCLKHCSTYNDSASLDNEAVLFEQLKDYGMTPLHGWMRSMECFMIAGECKRVETKGVTRKEARKSMQKEFLSKEGKGLRVFFPNPKGGNSNTGPTSRRFFENAATTAKILDCPKAGVSFLRIFLFIFLLF